MTRATTRARRRPRPARAKKSHPRLVYLEMALTLLEAVPALHPYARILRTFTRALSDETLARSLAQVKRDLFRVETREMRAFRRKVLSHARSKIRRPAHETDGPRSRSRP